MILRRRLLLIADIFALFADAAAHYAILPLRLLPQHDAAYMMLLCQLSPFTRRIRCRDAIALSLRLHAHARHALSGVDMRACQSAL